MAEKSNYMVLVTHDIDEAIFLSSKVVVYDVAQILEYSCQEQITKLMIPAALLNILLGICLALSAAWMCLVVAELLGADSGRLHDPGRSFLYANRYCFCRDYHFCLSW